MLQVPGSSQGVFANLILFLVRVWRFIALTLIAIIAIILGAVAFLIIIVPLIIYILITKRKFINIMRTSKANFSTKQTANNFKYFSSQQSHPFQQEEEEVDIDIPASKD